MRNTSNYNIITIFVKSYLVLKIKVIYLFLIFLNYYLFIFRLFFSPSIFLNLQESKYKGYLSIDTFFNYIMKKIWMDQTRNGLSQYDLSGFGYLSESVI